jgi:hypothetical protein
MKSQTGQLARRATNAVMPIGGANPSGMRKTSFRSSTTFIPYKHEDDNSDDSDEDSEGEDGAEESVRPSFNTAGTVCHRCYVPVGCRTILFQVDCAVDGQ